MASGIIASPNQIGVLAAGIVAPPIPPPPATVVPSVPASTVGDAAAVDSSVIAMIGTMMMAAPVVMTLHSHPWGLSFYTPVVGGVPGAANLGLNRSFWGYTTDAVLGFINQRAPRNASVYVHDTALQSFDMLKLDGRVRRDLRPTLAIHQSQLALYHHEAHMRRVEYQIWVDYETATPAALGVYDGVPIVWVYERGHPAP